MASGSLGIGGKKTRISKMQNSKRLRIDQIGMPEWQGLSFISGFDRGNRLRRSLLDRNYERHRSDDQRGSENRTRRQGFIREERTEEHGNDRVDIGVSGDLGGLTMP